MTDKTQPRDWSEAIDKLAKAAIEQARQHDGWVGGYSYNIAAFKVEAAAILQEFDAQNQPNVSDNGASGVNMSDKPVLAENATTEGLLNQVSPILNQVSPIIDDEEPIKFVVGELYEDRKSIVYQFMGINKLARNKYDHIFAYATGIKNFAPCGRCGEDGDTGYHYDNNIIKKHTPKPVEHIYSREEIEAQIVWGEANKMQPYTDIIKQLLKQIENIK